MYIYICICIYIYTHWLFNHRVIKHFTFKCLLILEKIAHISFLKSEIPTHNLKTKACLLVRTFQKLILKTCNSDCLSKPLNHCQSRLISSGKWLPSSSVVSFHTAHYLNWCLTPRSADDGSIKSLLEEKLTQERRDVLSRRSFSPSACPTPPIAQPVRTLRPFWIGKGREGPPIKQFNQHCYDLKVDLFPIRCWPISDTTDQGQNVYNCVFCYHLHSFMSFQTCMMKIFLCAFFHTVNVVLDLIDYYYMDKTSWNILQNIYFCVA